MKGILIFICGFIVGVLFTVSVTLIMINNGTKSHSKDKVQVQYIEVKGKKGNVMLHTGISKDSVRILVGKPDEIDLHEIVNTHYEKWGYKLKNQYVSDLDIDFEDGKLIGVRQD